MTEPYYDDRTSMARPLRPYQAEAVHAITEGLANGGPGQLHAACGSGKTLIAMRAAEQLVGPDGLVVVLAPSLGLVAQILDNWREDSTTDFQRFAVCSDRALVNDEMTVDLAELHVPVSTGREQIAKWLTADGPRLIVGTYLSAPRLAEAVRNAGVELDMLICDEAHHLAGSADSHTRRIVDNAALPARRRLYVTATPRIGGGSQSRSRTLSMDDLDTFGPVLYSYPFSRAIAEGYLEDYRIAVIGVGSEEVRALLGRDDVEFAKGVDMRTGVAQIALARAYRDFGMRRVLSFHGRIADAQRFVDTLPATLAGLPDDARVPEPTCLHANGRMDGAQRAQVIDQLKNPPGGGWVVASNVRCLSEGVDVPALDGVLFAIPKNSPVDVVQSASRALRRHPDTPGLSTIIVPVLVPDSGDEVEEIDAGPFEALTAIVRALREHDDALSAQLNVSAARLASGDSAGGDEPPDKIVISIPEGVSSKLLGTIRLVVVRQAASSWWAMYGCAKTYRAKHGDLRVPVAGADRKLASWLAVQRKQANERTLSDDKRRALDALGIEWGKKTYGEQRSAMDAAQQYHARNGNLLTRGDLGRRLSNLRELHQGGILDSDVKAQLDHLGMVWSNEEHEDLVRCQAARKFRSTFGDLRVPTGYVDDSEVRVGEWLDLVRPDGFYISRFVRHTRQITDSVRRALDDAGMVWNAREDDEYYLLEAWFESWLESDRNYRRQPFDQVGPPKAADILSFKRNLGALYAHADQAAHFDSGRYDAYCAAQRAGRAFEANLRCVVSECGFTTSSAGPALEESRDGECPKCGAGAASDTNGKSVALIDRWLLDDSVQHLYRCKACGHRWSRTWVLAFPLDPSRVAAGPAR